MKTVNFSIATLICLLSNFVFAQSQRIEILDDTKNTIKQELLYCGMKYDDDSTKAKAPSSRVDVKETPKKQTKKNLPTKSERPAVPRREE
jgi:hypothetical protein